MREITFGEWDHPKKNERRGKKSSSQMFLGYGNESTNNARKKGIDCRTLNIEIRNKWR